MYIYIIHDYIISVCWRCTMVYPIFRLGPIGSQLPAMQAKVLPATNPPQRALELALLFFFFFKHQIRYIESIECILRKIDTKNCDI